VTRAGRLRERARFQRLSGTGGTDRFGNSDAAAWGDLLTVWGDLREAPGKERIAAGRLEGPVQATLRIRGTGQAITITAADRVVIRGNTWAIVSEPIALDARKQLLEIGLERGGAVE